MDKLKQLGPLAVVAMFPTLLLVLRSLTAVKIVFFAAVGGLAFLAGESVGRALPRPAIIAWSIISVLGIVVATSFGLLAQGPSLPVNLGKLALIAVVVGVPARALAVQRWPEKTLSGTRTEPDMCSPRHSRGGE